MKKEVRICPICGQSYSYVEHRKTRHNEYTYFVHVKIINGRRKIKKCYGGATRKYKYVEKLHFDLNLGLVGVEKSDRAVQYLRAILEFFNNMLINREYEKLSEEERELLKKLSDILEEINWEITYILSQNK